MRQDASSGNTSVQPQPDPAIRPASTVAVQYQPRTKALRRYISLYAIANLGIGLLWGSITIILLPLHVQNLEFSSIFTGADAGTNLQALTNLAAQVKANEVVPTAEEQRLLGLLATYNASKATSLSLVTSVGVFVTMLIQPIVGMLSDRTRSKWGRRTPFIAGGAVVGGALVALLPIVPNIAFLVIVWSVVQLVVNIAQGPLSATVADRVPEERIGGVSAITGLVAYLAAIGGSVVAGILFAQIGLATYFPIALVLILSVMAFVLVARDKSSRDIVTEPLSVGIFFKSFVTALRDRDYRWAWISKVFLYIGYGIGTVYAIYMLQSYVTPALSAEEAAQTAPLLMFAGLPGTLVAMVISGRWSDKIGRRKPFVMAAAIIMAASFLVPFAWPTVTGMFVQAIVAGIGLGTFIVVDQALFIDVLPDRNAAGRDLGLSTLGQNLGQAIGPVIAGVVVAISGGFYGPVWPVAFALVLAAAFAVLPIRRVR